MQFQTYGAGKSVYEKGEVASITSRTCGGTQAPGNTPSICSTSNVRLSSGPDKGKVVSITTGGAGDVTLHPGDRIRVVRGPVINPATGQRVYEFDDYIRDTPLLVLAAIFAVVLVLVARWRGITALLGLAVAYLVLVYFLLPALLDGRSPVETALVSGAAILLVVLYIAHGFSMRTTTALLGTLIALGVTAGFAAVATSAAHLTGRSSDYVGDLESSGVKISISGLILCGLIIGSLGVINDITVTQASSVWELSAAEPHASWRTLFTRGMRIGRDHISSVIYTLIFAYTGAALPALLLFSISGRSLHDLVTGDEIAGEIVRDLVGGVGSDAGRPVHHPDRGDRRGAPARRRRAGTGRRGAGRRPAFRSSARGPLLPPRTRRPRRPHRTISLQRKPRPNPPDNLSGPVSDHSRDTP